MIDTNDRAIDRLGDSIVVQTRDAMIIVVRILEVLVEAWILLKVIASENGVPLRANLIASRR
jgi:hypothetical protein